MTPRVYDSRMPRRLAFAVAINVLYLAWIKWHPVSAATFKGITDFSTIIIGLLGAGWALQAVRGQGSLPRRQQWAVTLVGLSVLAFGLGECVWFYDEVLKHREVPFPSWADAYFLASYPTLVVGVLLMPTRAVPSALRGRVLLDSLMMLTGLITLSWYFLLGPTLLQGSETLLGRILGLGYPLGDLAALLCLLIISAHPAEAAMRPSRRLLSWGILAYVVADVGFGYMTLRGTYVTGQFSDVGWTLGNLLIGLGATAYCQAASTTYGQDTDLTAEQRNPILWRALLPYAFVPAVGLLLFYTLRHTGDQRLERGVYIGSATLIALVGLRQVFALLENNRLYRYLQDAYREQEADRRSLAESNARLEALATTDGMTGLPNHRAFQERLQHELAQAKRTGCAVSLLLLDVDRFKHYNDNFGHPAGDEALRLVAHMIRENVREGDFAARYGGEEFTVLLPDADTFAAAAVAERIRAAVAAYLFPHRLVTVSIGLAVWTPGEAAQTLIKRADAALYTAKHEGRNRVCLAGDGLSPKATLSPKSDLCLSDKSDVCLSEQEVSAVSCLLAALDLRDGETEEHSERVARYAMRLAEEATQRGVLSLDAVAQRALLLGALLHDVGKIGTPDHILHKPGRLEAAEWAQMCEHPVQGAALLRRFPCLSEADCVVLHHHEHWDGSGYPSGLAQEQIPVVARLFTIVDALDAMTSDRPYRKALSFSAAQEEIARVAATQFDPALVQVFLAIPSAEWQHLCQEAEQGMAGMPYSLPKAA